MSVQSEITRLTTAKADIKTAIEGKGVTVPDATTLDGMAALIEAIETGGGGSDTSIEDSLITRTVTEYTNNRVTRVGAYAFYACSNLSTASFPLATIVELYAFNSCSNLSTASFPLAMRVGGYAFNYCGRLTAVILGNTSQVCTLSNTNAFTNCYHILGTKHTTYNPTGAKDGYIYVPDDLVDSYKAATNWSTYASQIKPLSDYTGELA